MNKLRRWWLAPMVGVCLVGCQPKAPGASAETNEPKPPTETPEATPPVATKIDLPAAYRHAGFEYYGLGNSKPLSMVLKRTGSTMTGGQEFKLEDVKDDGAVYVQQWTGDLAPNGSTKLRVNAEGIFGIEAQGNPINPAQLEMPADPKPGFKWSSAAKIVLAGGSIDSTDSKIIGMKSIKIGGKATEVLLIERVSKAKLPDPAGKIVDQTLKSVEYYQKGVGAVRVEVTVSGKGVPTNTFSMEAKP